MYYVPARLVGSTVIDRPGSSVVPARRPVVPGRRRPVVPGRRRPVVLARQCVNVRSSRLVDVRSSRLVDVRSYRLVAKGGGRPGPFWARPGIRATADHGRSDWLGYWVKFVQKACFKKLACLCHIKQNDLTYMGRFCRPCLSVSAGICGMGIAIAA